MSTDFSVVNHTKRTWWHLGQRMADTYSFGYGSNDVDGRSAVAHLIVENLGHQTREGRRKSDLRIVSTDDVPDDYTEICQRKRSEQL